MAQAPCTKMLLKSLLNQSMEPSFDLMLAWPEPQFVWAKFLTLAFEPKTTDVNRPLCHKSELFVRIFFLLLSTISENLKCTKNISLKKLLYLHFLDVVGSPSKLWLLAIIQIPLYIGFLRRWWVCEPASSRQQLRQLRQLQHLRQLHRSIGFAPSSVATDTSG